MTHTTIKAGNVWLAPSNEVASCWRKEQDKSAQMKYCKQFGESFGIAEHKSGLEDCMRRDCSAFALIPRSDLRYISVRRHPLTSVT